MLRHAIAVTAHTAGLWRGLGHGHRVLGCVVPCLCVAVFIAAFGGIVVAALAELFARRPADGRAHRGDVAQQELEVVAAPVVKDHGDGDGDGAAMLQEWHSAPRYCPAPWQWWSFFLASRRTRGTPCSERRPCAPAAEFGVSS